MLDFFGPVLWLVVALGLLIAFHEFGHFWVARRAGVRVLQFSIGFGPALWSRQGRDGTEYRIAAIPLGGYVRMLDEHEGPVAPDQLDQAFNRKSLARRSAIVAAGPAFNFIFAIVAFWLMFVIGILETRPVVGQVSGLAAEAGLERDDLVLDVDGRETQTWTHAMLALMPAALDREPASLTVEDPAGNRRQLWLPLDRLGPSFDESRALEEIGIERWRPDLPPVVGEVSPGSPAADAGLRADDRIGAVGDEPVDGWRDVARLVPERGLDDRGSPVPLSVQVERSGQRITRQITPRIDDGRPVLGIQSRPPDPSLQADFERAFTVMRHGPVDALAEAVGETGRLTAATFGMLGRMLTGKASLSNLSGPITIAQMAHSSALLGVSRFLFFLGLISLSLAIINLLPIPVLDGGHLMYYLVEFVKGSPISEQARMTGQYVGILLVVGLMGLAIFNDLLRLFS